MSKRIQNKKKKVITLLNQIIDLQYHDLIKGAKRFEEIEFNKGSRNHPNLVAAKRMYWNERFFDEDEKPLKVERTQLIEVEGERTDHMGKPLKYYTLEDIN